MSEVTVGKTDQAQPIAGTRRTVTILLLGALVLAAAIFAARIFAPWLFSDNSIAVEYTTEAGKSTEGTVNSPLTVKVRMPSLGGSGQVSLSSVNLILLDELGDPAIYGDKPAQALPMRPTVDMQTWEYVGSLPSKPGSYHPRFQWRRLSGDRSIQTLDVEEPVLVAKADNGPPLESGLVFNAEGDLWMLAADGTRQRRFTFLSTLADRVEYPAWSPDGKLIAFAYLTGIASNELPKTSIWTINADGTGARPLVEHGPNESLCYPQWSPDDNYLYFTVENLLTETNGAPQPRRIDRLEIATGIRSQWIASAAQPSPTGAGDEVVFLEELTNPEGAYSRLQIAKAAADEAPHTVVVPNSAFYDLYAPRISPDRKWVVFAAAQPSSGRADNPDSSFNLLSWLTFEPRTASAHNFPWELFLVPASGGEIHRLTNLSDDQPYSAWIDNNTIAFIGIKGLYKLTIDSGGNPAGDPVRLTDGVQHSTLTWHSP